MRIPFVTTNLQYLAAFWAALTYLMSGMISGWVSPILPRLQEPGSWLPLTADEASWIVSSMTISCVLPIIGVPIIVDIVGRKVLFIASGLPVFASWLMVLFADSAAMLIASRLVAGLGIGASICLLPMYVGEVAEAKVRGMLGTVFQFAMSVGGLVSYCMGPYMSYSAVAIVSAAVPVVFMVGFLWMPESPYFLALRGRDKDAERALRRLRGAMTEEAIQEELGVIHKYVKEQRGVQHPGDRPTAVGRRGRGVRVGREGGRYIALSKLFQVISDATGIYAVFFLFMASAVVGLVFTFFFLPETRGRTFIEITRHFEGEEDEETK
ncbi:facilitated trehalose transporter Tret1-2 homolog [Schistocerca cancellata]|uniref:facilitated trehalose transporter Tret1-2 homolog n=1 Tax=Schistocerca cancellata TaxID=274614 RepID=UPI002118F154|nr:facilitated trehalose transporter Tret1-2 homolog [Schistocerca cancellata]